jgi:hypothetical protein
MLTTFLYVCEYLAVILKIDSRKSWSMMIASNSVDSQASSSEEGYLFCNLYFFKSYN